MSQTNPSPSSKGDLGQNSIARHLDCDVVRRDRDHERITDVAELEAGDHILVGDRQKPLVIRDKRSRRVDAHGGWVDQHEVDVAGEWKGAVTLTLTTQISRTAGEPTGKICVDHGRPAPVWRVDR